MSINSFIGSYDSSYEYECSYDGECIIINKYSPMKLLFGRIILKHRSLVDTITFNPNTPIQYIDEYVKFAYDCFNEKPSGNKIMDLLNLTLAINGESGEFGDLIKKAVFFSAPIDQADLCDELGDIFFYYINIITFFGMTLEDVINANIIKIHERYPNGRDQSFLSNVRNKREEKRKIREFFDRIGLNKNITDILK